MALTPPLLYATIMRNAPATANPFLGPAFAQLALGVANGVCAWAVGQPQNVGLVGAAVGTLGAGTIVTPASRVIVPPTIPVMQGALSGAGLNGPLGISLGIAMTLAISEAFTLYGQYSGVSAGVGVGADVSKITVANAPSLIALLQASLAGVAVAGLASPLMATGLGNGIAALLLLGTGTAPIGGSPPIPPVPAAGATLSVLV